MSAVHKHVFENLKIIVLVKTKYTRNAYYAVLDIRRNRNTDICTSCIVIVFDNANGQHWIAECIVCCVLYNNVQYTVWTQFITIYRVRIYGVAFCGLQKNKNKKNINKIKN